MRLNRSRALWSVRHGVWLVTLAQLGACSSDGLVERSFGSDASVNYFYDPPAPDAGHAADHLAPPDVGHDTGPPPDIGPSPDAGPAPPDTVADAPDATPEPPDTSSDSGQDTSAPPDTGPELPPDAAWIGGACQSSADCGWDTGTCLADLPGGSCTEPCTLYCPDAVGYPTTFCITPPPDAGLGNDGLCFSRCDYQAYPESDGCRPGWACVPWSRAGDPGTQKPTCVPADWAPTETCSDPTNFAGNNDCYFAQLAMGDAELEALATVLLLGTADADDAKAFLDLNFARSQEYLYLELGITSPNPKSSAGHPVPMHGMIVHYTTGQTGTSTIKYFASNPNAHASTHFITGSFFNGLIVQLVSHEDRSAHAAEYNPTHFGFDFANAGYLDPVAAGFEDAYGKPYALNLPTYGNQPAYVPDGIPNAPASAPGGPGKYAVRDWWQPYSYYQLLSFIAVGRALHLVYTLDEDLVQRHGDVHQSRVDPGPQLALTALRPLLFDQQNVFAVDWLNDYKTDPYWIEDHAEAR